MSHLGGCRIPNHPQFDRQMAERKSPKAAQARVKFCWECGNKLWNPSRFVEMVADRHLRILHKECAEKIVKERRNK